MLSAILMFAGANAAMAALADMSAQDAFRAAQRAWPTAYPRYCRYTAVIRYKTGERAITRSWDVFEDLRRRVVHGDSVSHEERTNPHVPIGTNIGVYGSVKWTGRAVELGTGGPKGRPPKGMIVNREHDEDVVGPLSLAIDQDFGLSFHALPITATTSLAAAIGGPRVLARIGGTASNAPPDYDVERVGLEDDLTGQQVLHLRLTPRRDSRRFRLRELWIEAVSGVPRRATVSGIGNRAPFDATPWRIEYKLVDGALYIDSETALEPLEANRFAIRDVTITFSDLQLGIDPGSSTVGASSSLGLADPQ